MFGPTATADGSVTFVFSTTPGEGTPGSHSAAPTASSTRSKKRAADALNSVESSKRRMVDSNVNGGQSATPSSRGSTSNVAAVASTSRTPSSNQGAVAPVSPAKKHICSNKTCHRTLPANMANTVGVLCDKCKERLKKKAIKAKQRFKLEPRKLVASNSGEMSVAVV